MHSHCLTIWIIVFSILCYSHNPLPNQPAPPHSLRPFFLSLSISLPLFSSAMFLASRCLTYFLRLLQCSPPSVSWKHTHTHWGSQSPSYLYPHTSPSVPGNQDSTSGTCSGCSLIGWAPENLHMDKSGQRGEFCPEVICTYFFYVTVATIPYDHRTDVSNIIAVRLRRWAALVLVESNEAERCEICPQSEFFHAAVLLDLTNAVITPVQTHTHKHTPQKMAQNCSNIMSSM